MALESGIPSHNLVTTKSFVKLAASKFRWGDLSDNILMDIGCGKGLYCARTLLGEFPKVKTIIALDADPTELGAISTVPPKITPFRANILNRNDIRPYEGKIHIALSTHVFHQIPDKEKVFQNVYRLLKPGGQAAFLFTSDLSLYHALEHLRLDPKYKDYYKGGEVMDFYSRQLKAHDYEEMLKKTGFKVIEISEEKESIPIEIFEYFKKILHQSVDKVFSIPSELVQEIHKLASNFFQAKFCDRKSIRTGTEMSIFVTKPVNSATGCSNF